MLLVNAKDAVALTILWHTFEMKKEPWEPNRKFLKECNGELTSLCPVKLNFIVL